jgi:cell division protein FtsI (penicillin-binding protein 3)
MRNLLYSAVEHGTGNLAKLDSIEIGGKTGTSKIIVNGKYSDDLYYSSFVGFYPVDDPQLVCYVLINKPKGKYYGGLVAAPVFKNIVSRINALRKGELQEPILNDDYRSVKNKIDVNDDDPIYSILNNGNQTEVKNVFMSGYNKNFMPDLRGKTIKEALLFLNEMEMNCNISGSGVIVEQSISPGTSIINKKTCSLKCSQVSSTGLRIY